MPERPGEAQVSALQGAVNRMAAVRDASRQAAAEAKATAGPPPPPQPTGTVAGPEGPGHAPA